MQDWTHWRVGARRYQKKKKKRLAKTTRRLNYKKKKEEATTAQQKGEEPQGQEWHAHARRPGRCVVVRDEGSFANHVTTNATRVFVEKVFRSTCNGFNIYDVKPLNTAATQVLFTFSCIKLIRWTVASHSWWHSSSVCWVANWWAFNFIFSSQIEGKSFWKDNAWGWVVAGAGKVWWRIHSRGKSRVPWTAGEGEEGWFGCSWSYNIIEEWNWWMRLRGSESQNMEIWFGGHVQSSTRISGQSSSMPYCPLYKPLKT